LCVFVLFDRRVALVHIHPVSAFPSTANTALGRARQPFSRSLRASLASSVSIWLFRLYPRWGRTVKLTMARFVPKLPLTEPQDGGIMGLTLNLTFGTGGHEDGLPRVGCGPGAGAG
jgi:hypothetical protein